MAIVDASGNVLTKAQLEAKTSTITEAVRRTVDETVYETFTYRGKTDFEGGKRIKYVAGQIVSQAAIDALYVAGTVTDVSPTTIAVAGGTVVTITGTNFGGSTSVTFGGTAGTNFKKLSATQIQVTSPAKTAGAHAVVVVDDGGNIAAGNVTAA